MDHDVVLDYVGLSLPSRERLTCMSPGCQTATLVRQPYMTATDFEARAVAFLKIHETTKVTLAGKRVVMTKEEKRRAQGIKTIIALQKMGGVEESEENAAKGWDAMTEADRDNTFAAARALLPEEKSDA